MSRGLTPRQKKFCEVFTGNGTEAARIAGYTGNDNVLGKTAHDLLRNPKVSQAIRERQEMEQRPHIAKRMERQAFWTRVMNDRSEDMRNRLKASELLGRSEADFTDKIDVKDLDRPLKDRSDQELVALLQVSLSKGRESGQ